MLLLINPGKVIRPPLNNSPFYNMKDFLQTINIGANLPMSGCPSRFSPMSHCLMLRENPKSYIMWSTGLSKKNTAAWLKWPTLHSNKPEMFCGKIILGLCVNEWYQKSMNWEKVVLHSFWFNRVIFFPTWFLKIALRFRGTWIHIEICVFLLSSEVIGYINEDKAYLGPEKLKRIIDYE